MAQKTPPGAEDQDRRNVFRIGTGQPKVFNDQAAIPAALRAGRTLEDSRNYHVVGCVEIDAGGKEYGWHDAAYFSISKVLELAINDGRCIGCGQHCPRWDACGGLGKKIGPSTVASPTSPPSNRCWKPTTGR